MNLFDGYCYPTIDDAARVDMAKGGLVINDVSGTTHHIASAYSYDVLDATQVLFHLKGYDFSTGSVDYFAGVFRFYPVCDTVGPYPPSSTGFFAGVTLSDVITTSWLIAAVWIAAWSVKTMRRGARS